MQHVSKKCDCKISILATPQRYIPTPMFGPASYITASANPLPIGCVAW